MVQLEEKQFRPLNPKWTAGTYYDYPDGEDLVGKLWFSTKIGAFIGAVTGALASHMHPVPKTLSGKILRNVRFLVPAVGASAIFTLVTYFSTNFRKKDDLINHALGGLIGGSFLAIGTPGSTYKVTGGIGCSILALSMKWVSLNGGILQASSPKAVQPYFIRAINKLSFVEERKGNWTRVPPS